MNRSAALLVVLVVVPSIARAQDPGMQLMQVMMRSPAMSADGKHIALYSTAPGDDPASKTSLAALERAVLMPGGPPICRTSAFDALIRLGVQRARLEVVLAPGLEHADETLRRSSRLCLEQLGA